MLKLGLRYLCGRSTATDPSDRDRAEWPPHPGRVYMALAAAFFQGDRDQKERRALEALESLPPPEIFAPRGGSRSVVTRYVPVNDSEKPYEKRGKRIVFFPPMGSRRIGRNRQPRTFPSIPLPLDAEVQLFWPDAELEEDLRTALSDLCSRVSRVGHSSSVVQMYLAETDPSDDLEHWHPADEGAHRELRVTGPGRLAELEASYAHELRPSTGLWSGYRSGVPAREEIASTLFDSNLMILRIVEGPTVDLTSTLNLTRALRGAVINQAPEPVPEVISGHLPDGGPSKKPHLAFVPLAHVGHEHADGRILGLAVVLPEDLSSSERRLCLGAVAGSHRRANGELFLPLYLGSARGRSLEWELEPEYREPPPQTLTGRTWTRPSTIWASVTPVVLDRYADEEEEQRRILALSCRRIGLPEPTEIRLSKVSWWIGAPSAPEMRPLTKGSDGPRRFHLHARLRFDRPVRGPLLLGAGRYRGYGLCRPILDRSRGRGPSP